MRQPLNRKGPLKIEPISIQKILLIRLRRIGDIILTTPAIRVLRENLPQAEISFIVEEPYKELVEGNEDIDRIIVHQKSPKFREFLQSIKSIRREKYDVVIDFHGGPRASLLALFSRARIKIGYQIKYKSFIYDIRIPRKPSEGYIHSAENHINLVRALGIQVTTLPSLRLPEAKKEEIDKIKEIISEKDLEQTKIVTIHIGAGNEFRQWGKERFAELIRLLSQISNIQIILVGTPEDRETEDYILKHASSPVISLLGKLTLRELKLIIARSFLFIGVDSGPMHIAAATSTPLVALFGPNLSAINSPWKANAVVIEKNLDCRPCDQRNCIHKDIRCLRNITPEEVYQACLRFV
jgi:heptosyltransferase-1